MTACARRSHDTDYYIFCDSGLKHLEPLGVLPDLIVGDFDSHPVPHLPGRPSASPGEGRYRHHVCRPGGTAPGLFRGAAFGRHRAAAGSLPGQCRPFSTGLPPRAWWAQSGTTIPSWSWWGRRELPSPTATPNSRCSILAARPRASPSATPSIPWRDAEIPWDLPVWREQRAPAGRDRGDHRPGRKASVGEGHSTVGMDFPTARML